MSYPALTAAEPARSALGARPTLEAGMRTTLLITVLSAAALVLCPVVSRAAGLWPAVAGAGSEYFVPAHAGLLYVLVPVAAISASVLFLAPGLFLAVALGATRSLAAWLGHALGLSLVVVSVAAGTATAFAGAPVTGAAFAGLVLALTAACAAVAWWRVGRGRTEWPALTREERVTLWLLFAMPAVLYLATSPKLLWESFNGDGAHAFESSRLLVRHAMPFWPERAGPISGFPGLTSMLFAFPNAWYLRLFGELEASARLPFLLYVPVLFAALLSLAPVGGRRVTPARQTAVALGLVAYALAMAYSATYSPYSADIALPATQDTLLMICFLGAVGAFWRESWLWATLFAFLTYVSLPNGLILLGFLLVADVLVTRPRRWRRAGRLAATIVACAVAGAALTRLAAALGAPRPGGEYGLVGTLKYFAFLQFSDVTRLALVAVPAGLLPYFAIVLWRRQDGEARTLTLVTAAYFLFFFVQAHVSLHHFVPAMLLPVAVALRTLRDPSATAGAEEASARGILGRAGGWNAAWIAASLVAVVLSLPRRFAIQDSGRAVGSAIATRTGDYASSEPDVFRASSLLDQLFLLDWDPRVPYGAYGGSPLVWNHYARRLVDGETNYVLQRVGDAAPNGMRRVAADSGFALYVRDDTRWAADRALRPPTPAGSPVYFIPRSILFRSVPHTGSPYIVDVVAVLEAMGIDMTPILARLGVKR